MSVVDTQRGVRFSPLFFIRGSQPDRKISPISRVQSVHALHEQFERKIERDPSSRPLTHIVEPAAIEDRQKAIHYNASMFLHPNGQLMLLARDENVKNQDSNLVLYTIRGGLLVDKKILGFKAEDAYVFAAQEEGVTTLQCIYVKTVLDPKDKTNVKKYRTEIAPFDPESGTIGKPIAFGPWGQKGIRVVPSKDGGWNVFFRGREATGNKDGTKTVNSEIRKAHVQKLSDINTKVWEKAESVMVTSDPSDWLGLGASHGDKMYGHLATMNYEVVSHPKRRNQTVKQEARRPYFGALFDLSEGSTQEPKVVLTTKQFDEDFSRAHDGGAELLPKRPDLPEVVYPMQSFFIPVDGQPGKFRVLLVSGVKDRHIGLSKQPDEEIVELSEWEQHNLFYSSRILAANQASEAVPQLYSLPSSAEALRR